MESPRTRREDGARLLGAGRTPGLGAPRAGSPLGRGACPVLGQGSPGPGGGAHRARGRAEGAGQCPSAPVLSAPSPRQGAAERREGAAQAAGSAGHGAAAQAVALQAPRQPIPHQDGEDSAGPRLPDDPGAGKERNPLPLSPKAAVRHFTDGRDEDNICQSSSVS